MNIGEVIRNYRKEHGLSLRDFAVMCKLSHTYIDKLETGIDPTTGKDVTPTMRTIGLIAKAMGLTQQEFMSLAGYIPDNSNLKQLPEEIPKNKKLYDVIARAKDLPEQNIDELTDTLDALIGIHLKRLKDKKKK